MPPSDSDDGGDIPSRKDLKKKELDAAKKLQEEQNAEEEDEEGEEDEYVVESIVGHKFKKNGTLLLTVKWKGFPDEDNTDEPEENLEDCKPLDKYYEEIGGKPEKKTAAASDKKRKLSSGADTPALSSKSRNKRVKEEVVKKEAKLTKREKAEKDDSGRFTPPKGSWEDEIVSIDTMELSDNNVLHAYVVWKDGTKSQHPSSIVNVKCPQKMLQFYESHLQFNDTTKGKSTKYVPNALDDAEPQATNGASKADDAEDDIEDEADEDMGGIGIKGVASGIASAIADAIS